VLNGTVARLNLTNLTGSPNAVQVKAVVIGSGYTVQPNVAALILGPTGLAYDAAADTLYVASTADNEIFAVSQAGTRMSSSGKGTVIFQDEHLRGPLALAFAPNGDLITSNGDAVNADPTQPSEIVEFTKLGKFIGQFDVDAGQGGAFGLAIALVGGDTARLATVDDNTNSIMVVDQSVVP
jgi:sugar lactone lactonase YvrE